MAEEIHLCDACSADDIAYVTGYSKTELRKQGWQWRAIPGKKGQSFALCPECVKRYTPAWQVEGAA